MELFVINDCSSDNTLRVLTELNKKYNFKIINNSKNKGKAVSINEVTPMTRGEILMIIDSDIILSKSALNDIVSRFNNCSNLGAVSCGFNCYDKFFLSKMQTIEYNMVILTLGAFNLFSSTGLLGGCLAVKKEAFLKVGMFTKNAITEDTDLACKLNKFKFKVEQSFYPVYTKSPHQWGRWYKQKIRWGSGFAQCLLRYTLVYLKNPIFLFLILSSLLGVVLSVFLVYNNLLILKEIFAHITYPIIPIFSESLFGIKEYTMFFGTIIGFLVFPWLYVQYVLFNMKNSFNNYFKVFLVYYFVLIYLPLYVIVHLIAFSIGIYKFFILKEDDVGWSGN
jgi:cellulose synthase/poly-beta-1,6-N-acetylglucosamine synthase-like glycosyltransferase